MSPADDRVRALDGLAEEFLGRLRRGETPDIAAYERAHPDLARDIREVFPALLLMESLRPPRHAEAPAAPARPEAIGPYRVLREIGRGGMGRVYEAEAQDGARVAVKVPHAHLVGRAGFLARFLREARAGSAIRHAGVVRTLASGLFEQDGVEVPYLVLERIEAGTLRALLDAVGTVSERLAREIGAAVAEALASVHAAGIVHRDVKPENVFLLPDETVKLADLGVALLGDEADRITQTGEFVGSLRYAAPEQLEGGPVDPRTDLYALGLLLFELVTGRHPVEGPGGRRPARPGLRRPAPSLRTFAPHVSPLLEAVVRSLLSRDPQARPASAEETAEALRTGEQSAWWRRTAGAAPHARRPNVTGSFRGREPELAVLAEVWEAVRRGASSVVLVEGEAGVGKTRLLEAFAARLGSEDPDARVLWAETPAGEAPLGAWPLADALRGALDAAPLAGALEALLPGRQAQAAVLRRHLAGEPVPGADPPAIAAAYAAALRALSEERPLLLVVDDLHFASPDERDALARIAAGLGDAHVLVAATARPGVSLPRLPALRRIVLSGIDPAAASELARSALPPGATADEVHGLVHRSGGHPLFLLELARARATDRDEGREEGASLPASLRAIFEGRLAALHPDERQLLDLAACAGDGFDPVLLCDTLGIRHLEGLQRFHGLDRRHGLLVPDGDRYRFQHHLVEETVRDGLPPALRRALHGALGTAIEAASRDRPLTGILAQRVAHHFLLGEEPARASPYVVAALDHLHGILDFRRATELAERALAGGTSLPLATRAHASLILAYGRLTNGRPDEAREHLEEARRLAVEAADPDHEARALFHLAALRRGREPAEALALEELALRRAEAVGDPALRSVVLSSHASTLALVGRRTDARDRAAAALALARDSRDALVAAQAASQLGDIELQLGRAGEAREHLEFAVATARLHGHRLLAATAAMGLARNAVHEPAPTEAVRLMTEVLETARDLGYARMEAVVLGSLAAAHDLAGDREAASASATSAEALAARMGYADLKTQALAQLGQLRFAAGELGPGLRDLREAARLADAAPSISSTPFALAAYAEPAAWLGAFEDAHSALARREARFPATGTREQVRLALVRAGVAEAEERLDEAERLLRDAATRAVDASLGAEAITAALRLGLFLVERGDDEGAAAPLERALLGASDADLPAPTATARALLAILRGEDAATVRIALEAQAHRIPALLALRIERVLAVRRADARLAERVHGRLSGMLATTDAEDHARAVRAVPLVRRILGP